ncbi:hypothetical protein ACWEHA_07280 [Amycolatopsis nivea]
MNTSTATVSAETGPGIDPSVLDDALAKAREVCAAHPIATLAVSGRRTGHPAMADAVLADVRATLRGRPFDARAIRPTFQDALDHALSRLSEQLDRTPALATR